MKQFKKMSAIWVLGLLLLFCQNVQATGSQADDIMKKAAQVMDNIQVIQVDIAIDGAATMKLGIDKNTGVTYLSLVGSEMWLDQNNKMTYLRSDGACYFRPISDGDVWDTEDTDIEYNENVVYSYVGEEVYQNTECYKIAVVLANADASCMYYIEKDTYRVIAYMLQSAEGSIQYIYSYPERIDVPEEVKTKATMAEGYVITQKKVIYNCKYVKGKPVFYVLSEAKGAKGSIKIADSIKVCGKEYPVYGIGANAFTGNKKITSVTIGKNVQVIDKQAFYNCKKLKTIKITSTKLKKIGNKVFYGNAKNLKIKAPRKQLSKYKRWIKKSKTTSKIKYFKI